MWNGLSLWGRPSGSTQIRAEIGIKIKKPTAGTLDTGKMWFPAIMIDDCDTAIKAEGSNNADSCAFGYFRVRECDVGVHLDGANATMFMFRLMLPPGVGTIFQVTGGGRIYVAGMKVLNPAVVLDVAGSDLPNGFFHIGGIKADAQSGGMVLFRNVDSGDGNVYARFTDAQFVGEQIATAKVLIDRSGSTTGQTILELVGCKGVTVQGVVLTNNVVLKGASSSRPSRFIIRDSELNRNTVLINPNPDEDPELESSAYTINRLKNWLFGSGLEMDRFESG